MGIIKSNNRKTRHASGADEVRGFTLAELSIALVIIGFLVGAVITSKDLYKTSQLRAVITQILFGHRRALQMVIMMERSIQMQNIMMHGSI